MASYKVLQDIEAEDKFLGPLTLKQFILAAITTVGLYLSFYFLSRGVWLVAIILLPFEIVLGFLAFPWGRDQPTETWLLAKLRFYFKPRKRIWDQTGIQELVRITVPKRLEEHLTDGLSSIEVKSRLKALADTIDSRGWVIKNVNVNMFTQPAYGALSNPMDDSDRLVAASTLPQQTPVVDITADDDIFSNPLASRLDAQIQESKVEHQRTAVTHMQKVSERVNTPADQRPKPTPDFWFTDKPAAQPPGFSTFQDNATATITPHSVPTSTHKDEPIDAQSLALLDKVHKDRRHSGDIFRNHRRVDPVRPAQAASPAVTAGPAPDILNLAIDSNRKVDSLAREARKNHPEHPESSDDEVTISLR
jgi:hypothetical protein